MPSTPPRTGTLRRWFFIRCSVEARNEVKPDEPYVMSEFDLPKGWKVTQPQRRTNLTAAAQWRMIEGRPKRVLVKPQKGHHAVEDTPVLIRLGDFIELLDEWYKTHGRSWDDSEGRID